MVSHDMSGLESPGSRDPYVTDYCEHVNEFFWFNKMQGISWLDERPTEPQEDSALWSYLSLAGIKLGFLVVRSRDPPVCGVLCSLLNMSWHKTRSMIEWVTVWFDVKNETEEQLMIQQTGCILCEVWDEAEEKYEHQLYMLRFTLNMGWHKTRSVIERVTVWFDVKNEAEKQLMIQQTWCILCEVWDQAEESYKHQL